MIDQRPCDPEEAVYRATKLVELCARAMAEKPPDLATAGQYWLGTGDFRGAAGTDLDMPWTTNNGGTGSDCCGFAITWAYKLTRHRPGFNAGSWATVADDINCDSALEDARHKQELFFEVALQNDAPAAGDMLLYPSIRLPQHQPPFYMCGHVCIVTDASRWNRDRPRYADLVVAQCHGPNGFRPGVVHTDGSIWDHHDANWQLPQHRSAVIRAR
jgi:hypothetical protein